jgi:hypothetical protein
MCRVYLARAELETADHPLLDRPPGRMRRGAVGRRHRRRTPPHPRGHTIDDRRRQDRRRHRLADLGLTEAERNDLYDSFGTCEVDVRNAFIISITSRGDLHADQIDCLPGAVNDDRVRQLLVASITTGADAVDNDTTLFSEYKTAVAPCNNRPGEPD